MQIKKLNTSAVKLFTVFAFLAASSLSSTAASAAVFQINAYDDIYGPYTGTTSGSLSSPSSFSWQTAGFGVSGNIDLTYNGKVVADIITNDDNYTLYTGDSAIGLPSSATATIPVSIGQTVSLYNTISTLNGGLGVCCDFNGATPQIKFVAPTAPAPVIGYGLIEALAAIAAFAIFRFRKDHLLAVFKRRHKFGDGYNSFQI